MKQSNWILGIGVVVAIILIGGTIWVYATDVKESDTVLQQPTPVIEQPSSTVLLKRTKQLTSIINHYFR